MLLLSILDLSSNTSSTRAVLNQGSLPQVLSRDDFVSTYDPVTQNFFVWVISSKTVFFYEIGALNGVISNSNKQSLNGVYISAACPSPYSNSVLAVQSSSGIYYFEISSVSDKGVPSSTGFVNSPSNPLADPYDTVLPQMCAASSIENSTIFAPFSAQTDFSPYLYLFNASGSSFFNSYVVNQDRMSNIFGLTAIDAPFGASPIATRAIYLYALQTSLNIRVVESQNNTPSTITLPFTLPDYPRMYSLSNSISASASALDSKSGNYLFPLAGPPLYTGSNPSLHYISVSTDPKISRYVIIPTAVALDGSIVLTCATFP